MGELLDGRRAGVAIVDDAGPITWRELDDRVDRLVGHLRSTGLPVGSAVFTLSTNRREVVEVSLACHQGGWEHLPINWHLDASQIGRVVADLLRGDPSGPDPRTPAGTPDRRAVVIVVDAALVGLLLAALAEVDERPVSGPPVDRSVLVLDDGGSPENRPPGSDSYERALAAAAPDPVASDAPGGIVFHTSGTTGRVRGVRLVGASSAPPVAGDAPLLGHVFARAVAVVRAAAIPAAGRTLMTGPHYHWAQWLFGVGPLLTGSTLHLHHRFHPTGVLHAIDAQGITNTFVLPTQFVRLLRLDALTRRSFSGGSLERVVHGAAHCPPAVKRSMIEWWGPIITEYYGATEGGVVSLIPSEEWLERPGSVGRPVPWKSIEIVADDGSVAAAGTDGVIHVQNLDGLDVELVEAPAVTAAVHARPGFVTFADIGRLDVDGYLSLSDRATDMIVSGGTNVSSSVVEAVLGAHPGVVDVAVFGIPDPASGQAIVAAVQLGDGWTWSDELVSNLRSQCRTHLAPHQWPSQFEHVTELPRTATGKLVKRRLRAPYWSDE